MHVWRLHAQFLLQARDVPLSTVQHQRNYIHFDVNHTPRAFIVGLLKALAEPHCESRKTIV
jgi:hypothetical protein